MILNPPQKNMSSVRIDSLAKALDKLHIQTDSLQLISTKTQIGQGYFDKIIYLQLTIFVVIITIIIGLLGLISWQWIISPLNENIREVRDELQSLIGNQEAELNKHKLELDDKFNKLIEEQGIIARQAMRGIFYSTRDQNQTSTGVIWGLRLAENYFKAEKREVAGRWIIIVRDIINDPSGDISDIIDEFFEEIVVILNTIRSGIEEEAVLNSISEIEKECYKHKYSLSEK